MKRFEQTRVAPDPRKRKIRDRNANDWPRRALVELDIPIFEACARDVSHFPTVGIPISRDSKIPALAAEIPCKFPCGRCFPKRYRAQHLHAILISRFAGEISLPRGDWPVKVKKRREFTAVPSRSRATPPRARPPTPSVQHNALAYNNFPRQANIIVYTCVYIYIHIYTVVRSRACL